MSNHVFVVRTWQLFRYKGFRQGKAKRMYFLQEVQFIVIEWDVRRHSVTDKQCKLAFLIRHERIVICKRRATHNQRRNNSRNSHALLRRSNFFQFETNLLSSKCVSNINKAFVSGFISKIVVTRRLYRSVFYSCITIVYWQLTEFEFCVLIRSL